jgi:hypothetical protein
VKAGSAAGAIWLTACRRAATVEGGWGVSGCPAAEVVMAAPMGAILIPRTSLTGRVPVHRSKE